MTIRRVAKKCTTRMRMLFGLQVIFVITLVSSAYIFISSSFRRHIRSQFNAELCPRSDDVIAADAQLGCSAKPFRRLLIGKLPAYSSRLGNEMFMFAAQIGIAEEHGLTPVIEPGAKVTEAFRISSDVITRKVYLQPFGLNLTWFCEHSPYRYDETLVSEIRSSCFTKNFMIGFFHSWKYFRSASSRVRREMTFISELSNFAEAFLAKIDNPRDRSSQVRTVFVGVHIRRGDLLDNYNVFLGYTVADTVYLERAVIYIRDRLVGELDDTHALKLIFVVCSDDKHWSKRNFISATRRAENSRSRHAVPSVTMETVFSRERDGRKDMAILSRCNHTIMTVGSFGWWAAYLAGGITVYYDNFPSAKSYLANSFSASDYFPAGWVGL